MALKGDLASVGLADVFQMLALNQKVGILSIHSQARWRALYFDRPGVTLYYNEHVYLDRLLDVLVRRNLVDPSYLAEARRRNAGDPITTVESLIAEGHLEEQAFLEVFRDQMEEDIYDLFLWENVHWEFLEGVNRLEGREGVINEHFFLNADSLVMEAARRLDEWSYIREQVPSEMEVFEPAYEEKGELLAEVDESGMAILDLIDGKRNLQRVVESSGINAFHVFKTVSMLVQKGILRPVPPDELVPHAKECIEEARIEDGILMLERAIELGTGIPEAHLLAAKSYEMQNEAAKACWHYKSYAAYCLEQGDLDQAAQTLALVLQHLPTDLDAWERFVQVLVRQEEPEQDPHEVGKRLIDIYLELEEITRARSVLESLLESCPEDIELKKTLISVHSKAGDTRRVMELYESIADDFVARKDPLEAVRYLQKILMIDRSRSDVSDRIRLLIQKDEKIKSRKRGMIVLLTVLVGLLAAGTLYWLYDQKAREDLAKVDPSPFLERKDFEAAISLYRTFLKKHPLTLVESEVKAEIARIESAKEAHEAELEAARRRTLALARAKREEYRRLWEEYLLAEKKTPDLEKALRQLTRIKSLAEEAGRGADLAFLKENKVEDSIRRIRSHLEEAKRLHGALQAALDRGRVGEARKLALKLHKEYTLTKVAEKTLVPTRIGSIPGGARIQIGGKDLLDMEGKVVRTPAVLQLPFGRKVEVVLLKDGFLPGRLRLRGADEEPPPFLLGVRPRSVVDLPVPPVTGVLGCGDLWFLGLKGGKIAGLEKETGKILETFALPDLDEARSLLAVDSARISVFSVLGRILVLERRSGTPVWKAEVWKRGGRPLMVGGIFVFVGGDGSLEGRDRKTGERIWRLEDRAPGRSWIRWAHDRLWWIHRDGRVQSVSPDDGVLLSEIRVERGIRENPLVIGRALLLPSEGENWNWFDAVTKRTRKVSAGEGGGRGSWVAGGGRLIRVTEAGEIRILDPENGRLVRKGRIPGRPEGRIRFFQDSLFLPYVLGDGEGHVLRLSFPDLSLRWDYPVGAGVGDRISVVGDRVLLPSSDGRFHVLE